MKIVVYGNEYQYRYAEPLGQLLSLLAEEGADVAVDQGFCEHLRSMGVSVAAGGTVKQGAASEADLALSVGGDGTFLRTAEKVGRTGIPILGINTGHLGYLADADINDPARVAKLIITRGYRVEERTLLQVASNCPGVTLDYPFALNEVAILRQDTALMITMHTWVNGHELTTYKGDGLIISTPTGSTAYNLSVGGPILEPTSQNIVLSPVSVHSLTMRPLVLRDDSVVSVTTTSRVQRYRISLDGRPFTLSSESTITVRKAPYGVLVAQWPGHNFADTLRSKLMWGIDRRET